MWKEPRIFLPCFCFPTKITWTYQGIFFMSFFERHSLIIVYAILSRRSLCGKSILHSICTIHSSQEVHSFLTQTPTRYDEIPQSLIHKHQSQPALWVVFVNSPWSSPVIHFFTSNLFYLKVVLVLFKNTQHYIKSIVYFICKSFPAMEIQIV